MNILIIGNGGREHAFAWKIRQSPRCKKIFVAPGNAGTAAIASNIQIEVDNFPALEKFCVTEKIDLVLVGPEGPLVKGIRDYFESRPALRSILLVGPGKAGARLEGSKDFSKQFMIRHRIPTAAARTFHAGELSEALIFLKTCHLPIVLKADGLAAGKGVIIATTINEANRSMHEMLEGKKFGEASEKVLVEEFLDGIELSVFVLTDGEDYVILPEAKDYKRIGEADTGPNTGGMGAVSPVIFASAMFMKKVEEQIIRPTIAGLKIEGIPYRGFIFIGLIKVGDEPYVIEYNARMGDPETEAVMPRIKNDFVDFLEATATGKLKGMKIVHEEDHAVTVVLVSGGYPGTFNKGEVISGLEDVHNAIAFQAGTKSANGHIVTDGGRVVAMTGLGRSIREASENAYKAISGIQWNGLYFRKDIGLDLQKLTDK
jgi:phosphoribosylamine--glycine ligase